MVSGPNRVPGPNSVGLGYIKQALVPNKGGGARTPLPVFTNLSLIGQRNSAARKNKHVAEYAIQRVF